MIRFQHYYDLVDSKKIDMDHINILKDEKLFVTVGGGIAAGKSYWTERFVDLPVIDVDNFVAEIGGGVYHRENLSEGRKKFNKAMNSALVGENSFIHMGTNANFNGTKKRLELAKENNFTNILVLVETSEEKTLRQARKRFVEGYRNEIAESRILQSRQDAIEVFNQLKETKLVDFYVHKIN
jgi:predicted kinase